MCVCVCTLEEKVQVNLSPNCLDLRRRWLTQQNTDYLEVTRHSDNPAATVKYNVVWSDIYACPVVYIACYRHNQLVTLLDEFISVMEELQVVLTPDVGITQGEHPLFGYPVFFVHPCKTPETVSLLLQDEQIGTNSYAQVWLDTYGRIVGLWGNQAAS